MPINTYYNITCYCINTRICRANDRAKMTERRNANIDLFTRVEITSQFSWNTVNVNEIIDYSKVHCCKIAVQMSKQKENDTAFAATFDNLGEIYEDLSLFFAFLQIHHVSGRDVNCFKIQAYHKNRA